MIGASGFGHSAHGFPILRTLKGSFSRPRLIEHPSILLKFNSHRGISVEFSEVAEFVSSIIEDRRWDQKYFFQQADKYDDIYSSQVAARVTVGIYGL
jgi:hypothetical protein